MALLPFGGAPTPDASTTKKGKIQLAGDLTGSAASPVLATIISGSTVGSSSLVPVITYDNKGRITNTSTSAITAGVSRAFVFFSS